MLKLGKLHPESSLLLICDVQERFRSVIPCMWQVIATSRLMVRCSQALHVPIVCTEQYPKALGRTVNEIAEAFEKDKASVFEKNHFSMAIPEVRALIREHGKVRSVLLAGLETHVCVMQTALDLLEDGIDVHILCDGVSSQDAIDRKYALERMRQAGAFLTTSESSLFLLLQNSQHAQFKLISALLKDHKAELRSSAKVLD